MRETSRAKHAYADYVRLGPGRSLEKLLAVYRRRKNAPTTTMSVLKAWSSQHGWQARLAADADREIVEAQEREAERRRDAMTTGTALDYERVLALKHLATMIRADLEGGKLWLQDFKQLGSGEHAMIVVVERPNTALLEQYRGILDDISHETGGRKQVSLVDITLRIREEARELGLDPDAAVEAAQDLLRSVGGRRS